MAGGTPKKRKPRGRSNQRRSHYRIFAPSLGTCPQCKSPVLPHTACAVCGTYRGRTVLNIAAREAKQAKKERERRREAAEAGRA